MRARLMMKIISLLVMLVLTVMGARACSGKSSPSSPLNPATVISNGLGGLCADQQAEADATGGTDGSGGGGPAALQLPADRPDLVQAAAAAGFRGGSFSCPTTTTTGPGY